MQTTEKRLAYPIDLLEGDRPTTKQSFVVSSEADVTTASGDTEHPNPDPAAAGPSQRAEPLTDGAKRRAGVDSAFLRKHRIRIDEITSIDDVNDAAPAQRVWFKVRNVDADRDSVLEGA